MMITINAFLAAKGIYMLTLLLLALGVAGVIVCNNYMKKLICMNVMQVAVIFFFLCFGQKSPGTIPVALSEAVTAAEYINPLPHGLMLTAIVVSLGTTGVGLSLLLRIREKYGTIEEDDLLERQAILSRRDKRIIRSKRDSLNEAAAADEDRTQRKDSEA